MYFVSQPIVTNGLVLNMDAGNTLSYTSGSSTWRDLSGNNFTGSLVNSPVFTPSNGGALTFNGSNNRVTLGDNQTLQFTDNFSAFTWFKRNADTGLQGIVGNASYNNGGWMIAVSTAYPKQCVIVFNSTTEQNVTSDINAIELNTWYNVGFTFLSGVCRLYINGINVTTSTGHTVTKNTTSFLIGQASQGGWSYFNGSVANTQVYNRALTPSEVTQNFNALRGRYGL